MRIIAYLFLLIIVLLGVTFSILNSQIISVNYYLGRCNISLSMLLVLVFTVGALSAIIVSGWVLIKTKLYNHHLHKKLKMAEKEIENLRSIPLKDSH